MDSVLKKAEELENCLRLWRESLGVVSTPIEADTEEHTLSGIIQPVEGIRLPIPPLCSSVTGAIRERSKGQGRMEGAWQQVTAYIVQLEKRLREMELHTSQAKGNEACPSPSQEKCPRSRPVSASCRGAPHNEEIEREIRDSERLAQTDSHSHVLLLVFKWLNTAELCRVSQVCHHWRGVARHPDLWRTLSLRETVVTSKDLCNLGQWCRCTEVISLHGLMPEMAGLEEELHSYIARQRGSLEYGLAQLLSAAPHLTSLSVTECNLMITERLLWLCSVHCPQLRQFTYSSDEFPPSPAALWALSNGCTQVQSLHLPPYLGSPFSGYFNDFCLSSIAKGWPHLLHLTVGGAGITAAGLSEIVQYCPWLEELCAIHGPKLSSTDIRDMTAGGGLTALHSLSLSFTPISPKALYQLCIACPKLASVTLHISPNTYFPGQVSADTTILEKYHQIQLNFQELQKMPQLRDILHLHHHPLTTDTVI